VACAVGLAQLELIGADGFLDSVREAGNYFRSRLISLQEGHSEIGDIRGLGLMNAIELIHPDGSPDPKAAASVIADLLSKKILVYSCGVKGNTLRFMPPLNVEKNVLDHISQALDDSLSTVRG
jgi:4-aminobutyrate aminotransferase